MLLNILLGVFRAISQDSCSSPSCGPVAHRMRWTTTPGRVSVYTDGGRSCTTVYLFSEYHIAVLISKSATDQLNRKGNRETKDINLSGAASARCDVECEFDRSATG